MSESNLIPEDDQTTEKLKNVRAKVVEALKSLEPLFPHHKMTFVARNTNPKIKDADIIVTNDRQSGRVADLVANCERGEKLG